MGLDDSLTSDRDDTIMGPTVTCSVTIHLAVVLLRWGGQAHGSKGGEEKSEEWKGEVGLIRGRRGGETVVVKKSTDALTPCVESA